MGIISFITQVDYQVGDLDTPITHAQYDALAKKGHGGDKDFYALLDSNADGRWDTAYELSETNGSGKLTTLKSDDTAADPVSITATGRISNTAVGDLTGLVIYDNKHGFGISSRANGDGDGSRYLNNGEALDFALNPVGGQAQKLQMATFTVNTDDDHDRVSVLLDFDKSTLVRSGNSWQNNAAYSLSNLQDKDVVVIDFANHLISINAHAVTGVPASFWTSFAAAGQDNLTIGSAANDTEGFSLVNLALTTAAATGSNHVAVIGDPTVSSVTEEVAITGGNLTAIGTISISDADAGQSSFKTAVTSATGTLGTLSLAANGSYTYSVANSAVQYLGATDTKVDTFTVTSLDGTTKAVSFTIQGQNDAAVIGAPTVADVTEDSNPTTLTATGSISISDVDQGQGSFQTTVSGAGGNLGTLSLAANGSYTYSVADSAVQYLGASDTKVDTFTVTSLDGTQKLINFTIAGTNDAPMVSAAVSGGGNEDTTFSLNLLANASDVDHGAVLHVANVVWDEVPGNLPAGFAIVGNAISVDATGGAYQGLAQGEIFATHFTYDLVDEHGAAVTQHATVNITGTNDAPTVSAAVSGGGNEDTTFSLDLLANASDVDHGAVLHVANVVWDEVPGNLPAGFAIVGNAISVDATGGAYQGLAQGEIFATHFTYDLVDEHGAAVTQHATVNITGTNDAPVIASGGTTGAVQEDNNPLASGTLTAADVDHGAGITWSVVGGQPVNADFVSAIDEFSVIKNGSPFFVDSFSDGNPPPSAPNFIGGNPTSYAIPPGMTFVEMLDHAVLYGPLGPAPSPGVGPGAPNFVTETATLNSSVDPSGGPTGPGLRIGSTFSVAGKFEALTPDEPREGYGIRLTDRNLPTSPTPSNPTNIGNDVVELAVRRDADGHLAVQFRSLDFENNTTPVLLGQVVLTPSVLDGNEIVLRLNHNTANTTNITASFDIVDHDGNLLSSIAVPGLGHVFSNETWTRAQFIGTEPVENISYLVGQYGALTVDQQGDWKYVLFGGQPNVQELAQGETVTDSFQLRATDEHGVFDTKTVNVIVTGKNDAPVITGGVSNGAVQEDGVQSATGTLNVTDVDHSATKTWSVVGGTTPNLVADYHVQLDNFHITRNGSTFFDDPFSDNNPPPSAPLLFNGTPTSYSVGAGTLTEAGGRAVMDGVNGSPFAIGAGTGHFVTLNSNTSNFPADLGLGLKIDDDFTVEGRFDLTTPGAGENYGIRVSDANGPSHPGDDVIQLIVMPGGPLGGISFGLSRLDFVHSTVTPIAGSGIVPAAGDNQIVLRLSHQAANPGVITASWELLDNGVVTNAGTLAGPAKIFGLSTPSDTSDDELYTRGMFVAGEALSPISTLTGQYGTLSINQNGTWTYNLANGQANVQALAQGQSVTDGFQVLVTDEHGAAALQPVNITVIGQNDASVITGQSSGSVTEDAVLTATGDLNSTDVDNPNDAWAVVAAPAASSNGYGTYTINASGVWSYTLNNALPAVQALNNGGTLPDSFMVMTVDGTSQIVSIMINGANEIAPNQAPVVHLLQAGAGFAPAANFATGPTPGNVAIGDVNGDGKADLAVSNFPGHTTVSILLGNGSGGFGAPTPYSTNGLSPSSVVLADFNGDNMLDLATTNQDTASVAVLLNNGSGSFGPASLFFAQNPTSVTTGDFNEDGRLDLVVGQSIGNQISLFLGNGNGSFGPAQSLSPGFQVMQTAVGDLNHDGHLDIVAAANLGTSGPRAVVLLGNGTGAFAAPTHYLAANAGASAASIALGDFNGDGSLDVAQADTGAAGVSIMLGNGAGGFGPRASYGTVLPANSTADLVVADFNGDGKQDLALGNTALSGVTVMYGNGNGSFQPQVFFATGVNPTTLAVGDVNGDGLPDIVTPNLSSNNVSVLRNLPAVPTTNEDTALVINGISVSDADSGIDPIQVTLSVGHGGLSFGSTAGLSGDLAGGDGTLSFMGSQTAINAALASGLIYTPTLNYNGNDAVTITASDLGHNGSGGAQSDTDTFNFTVNPVNDAPVAIGDFASTFQNAAVTTGNVVLNDSDVDNVLTPASITGYSQGAHGSVLSNNNGTFTYTPSLNFIGADTFTYSISDGALSSSATVGITVAPAPAPMTVSNFTSINYVGAVDTYANGINNSGQIVGHASLGAFSLAVSAVGWELSGGVLSTIAYPGAHISVANAINNFGAVAGQYEPVSSTPRYGFIESGGVFTQTLSLPPGASTAEAGINDAGVTVGSSYFHNSHQYSSFMDIGGVITYFDEPLTPSGGNTFANGINNLNQITGTYTDSSGKSHGFLDVAGVFSTIDDPFGANGTLATKINNAGQIVGWYYDSSNKPHGFIDTGGVFVTVDNPLGTSGTLVQGINDAGQVVGYYIDSTNHNHGFVASLNNPVAQSTNDVLVGSSSGGVLVGGAGNDTFVYNAAPLAQSTTSDFVHGQDILQISAAGFGHGLTTGGTPTLLTGAPASVSAGPGGYFIFDNTDPTGGTLYYDPTGGSGADATAITKLQGVTTLLPSDFHVV